MSEEFSIKQRDQWLDLVRQGRQLPPRCFVVAYTICEHVNRASGLAFPSQRLIVSKTRLNERTVRDAIHALEAAGLLETGTLKGRGKGNRHTYRPLIRPDAKPAENCRSTKAHKPAILRGFTEPGKPAIPRSQTGRILPVPIEPLQNLESVTPGSAEGSALQARVSPTMAVSR